MSHKNEGRKTANIRECGRIHGKNGFAVFKNVFKKLDTNLKKIISLDY